MKNAVKKMKGKKVLSLLLAMIMVLSVSSPAISPLMGVIAKAADGDLVELAFNNLFVFEKWATNPNSTTVQVLKDGVVSTAGATLTTDIANGSFTFKKESMDSTEVYTAFSASTTDADYNATYYMMDVEPNTEYVFSYHITGNTYVFTPYIFYYDQDGLWIENGLNAFATPQYETNNMRFTTPANAGKIQVRWTIGDNTSAGNTSATSITATVKNIAIYEAEVFDNYISTQNLFDFAGWASNTNSTTTPDPSAGSFTPDVATETITFTNTSSGQGYLWTGFGIDTAASNDAYYTMDVSANTSYTLTYDITDSNLLGPIYCQPFIVEMDSDGKCITYYGYETPQLLGNKRVFTTQANTARIQVVFAVINDGAGVTRSCKVGNIGVYPTSVLSADYTTITGLPHRTVYTEGAGNYSNLPVPTAPDGKVFAGWYTGEDGSGKLITEDTEISYESYTVYPKFETEIDAGSLTVITPPTKTTYTVGEKFNPAGIVLEATVTTTEEVWHDADADGVKDSGEVTTEERKNTYTITSGFIYSPQTVGTTAGTQNITISYGGQTVTVPITVVDSIEKSVTVNGTQTTVAVANDEYTINLTSDFNRYELTYYSNSYVKGTLNTLATDGTTVSEEFFLEPSDNGLFESYIDGFLESLIYTNIATIKFEVLDKEFGTFELYTVETILAGVPTDNMQYQQDSTHKVGIDLSKGGSLAYLEELSGDVIAVAYGEGTAAEVDYESMIADTSGTVVREGINLINRHDPGRYVQQSYYGTREDPYVTGDYNGVTWNYNPVQGGNYQFESSKIIDFRITANQIYVKTRPLDWGKYSDEYANSEEGDFVDNDNDGVYEESEGDLMLDPRYGDDYITDSYMEAWYVFEDDTVKTYCRFVDYSGYPSATTTQELPAFYCVEPFNTFAYYNADTVWEEESKYDYANAEKVVDPDFWGVSANYNNMLIANDQSAINPSVDSKENWAAFMSSNDANSFGIGIYSAGVTNFHYGTYPQIYKEPASGSTAMTAEQFDNADMYEDGVLTMPSEQDATSYIAPVDTMVFESYKPVTYSYYIATGNLHDIREDFRMAVEKDEAAAAAQTVIAVPETAYMEGADGASKVGQYYVNNIINETDYSIETLAEREDAMSFSVHIDGATSFTVDITNVTNPSDDIDLYTKAGVEVANDEKLDLNVNTGTQTYDGTHYLAFNTTGISFGEKATAKWVITGYDSEGNVVGTYIAYTVLYANERTVGAVAEGRKEEISQNEISSWITGANGVDHSQRSPLGSFHGDYSASGYFKEDPLAYDTPLTNITSTGETADDLINVGTEYSDNAYVLQTATNGHDHSRAQSYLGLLRVDKSRYTNTNQIPNLKIGYDVLRLGDGGNRSLATYNIYYTLGTSESFTATDLNAKPSGWTDAGTQIVAGSVTPPVRETVIPSYSVSDIDGKYIHALNRARCWYTMDMGESTGDTMGLNSYSTAGTSLLCSLTDKGTLRDTVTQGYGLAEENYSEDSYAKFEEALEKAGTVLGDPSVTQEEIDNAQKDLNDAMDALVNVYYSLKYDNIFSAYELSQKLGSMTASQADYTTVGYDSGVITVTNEAMTAGETYTKYGSSDDYYKVTLQPNTEYVFEYDVTTTEKAQAFMFFYNASGANGDAPTSMSIKTNNGSWSAKSESNPWFGNYTNSAGTYHYAIKFTTGANTTQASFRFGNTSSNAVTSSFSNIRLVDAAHYYEDATYSATEAVYKENASYGTMATATRPGYTFTGWKDTAGNTVTGADIATEHKSIYSQWTQNSYTITYNANGGTGTVADQTTEYTADVKLASSGFTRPGYTLIGWSTDPNATEAQYSLGATASKLAGSGTVTLYAVWQAYDVNVTFDNLIDMIAWEKLTAGNAEATDFTGDGFTLTSNNGAGEGTFESPEFAVTADKQYKIDIDAEGGSWDVYIFFRNETTGGTGINFSDGTNRFSSNGGGNQTRIFTAPAGATKAVIRVDANGSSNTVKFSNIRVYEVGSIADGVSYETGKTVTNGKAYGTLPTPTRYGYNFAGWVDAAGTTVNADSIVNSDKTVNLFSTWEAMDPELVPDTVVIDFGLPVKIDVAVNDISMSGGTLTAIVKDKPSVTLDTQAYTSSQITNATEITLANGTAKIEDGKIVYTPSSTNYTAEEVFYYEYKTVDNEYYYTTVTVIPATSIYFEETMFTFTDSVVTVDGEEKEYKWQDAGASVGERFQSDDRPGTFTIDDADAVYGTDSAYSDCTTYSMGTAKFITVDQNSNKANPLATASFTFTGTGFDLFTATDNKAGLLTVSIYKDGTRVKGLAVNTYYGYTYDETANDGQGGYVASTEDNALFQVPAIRARDLGWGTYTVVVEPKYSYPFDVNYNKEYRVYVDSVRIYDPMNPDNDVANNAYLADGEYAPDYLRLRDTIVTKDENGDYNVSTYENSALFFDGYNPDMNDVTDVIKNGPKNEVYLAKGQAVAFNISATSALNLASVQLGMKLINNAGDAQVTIMNTQDQLPEEITLTSATEQFYKLDSAIVWDDAQLQQNKFETAYPIVILNSSDNDVVISLTSLKWAFEDAGADISTFSIIGDEQTFALAPAAIERALAISAVDPVAPENIAIDSPENINLEDGKGEFTITTEAQISKVTVNGVELTDYETNEEGKKVWKYSFDAEELGENVFEVVVYDDQGNQSETITNRINVVGEDSNDGSIVGDGSLTDGIFANDLIKMIFDFIRKIFELLGGALA